MVGFWSEAVRIEIERKRLVNPHLADEARNLRRVEGARERGHRSQTLAGTAGVHGGRNTTRNSRLLLVYKRQLARDCLSLLRETGME